MAKTLKAIKRKIVPKKISGDDLNAHGKVVLVGTYRDDQLTAWEGYYNYPLSKDDKITEAAAKAINELWLFKGTKEPQYFAAEFVGVKTREELKRDFAYPAKGKTHGGGTYLLFRRTGKLYEPSTGFAEEVFVRTEDFSRTPKVRSQLKAYLESEDRKDPKLAKMLPSIITKLPPKVLRVCEAALQLDFFAEMNIQENEKFPFPTPKEGKFTFIDLFAGIGGIRLGYQLNGGRCVFSSVVISKPL